MTMKTRIYIQTCHGREKHLWAMLQSLVESGYPSQEIERLTICVDGDASVVDGGTPFDVVQLSRQSKGNLRTFMAIMSRAFAEGQPGDRMLFFEDDISFCKNALTRMLRVGVPSGCAFTTFFDMKEFFPGTPYGLYRVPLQGVDGRGFWGLQAVMFPHETVKAFHESVVPAQQAEKLKSHSDMVLVKALGAQYESYCGHVPCLVEHEGATDSAIWKFDEHEINRRATNYRHGGFDAASLPVYS